MIFRNKTKPQPLTGLLAQVSPGIRAGELWPAYLRWAGKTPGYFGGTLKTVYEITADYDLFACHTRLGLPVGQAPLLGRFKALSASRVGHGSPPTPKTPEKGISAPAITRLRLNPSKRKRLLPGKLAYFNI